MTDQLDQQSSAIILLQERVKELEDREEKSLLISTQFREEIRQFISMQQQITEHKKTDPSAASAQNRGGKPAQRDGSPGPKSRRERPRSGSLPPSLSCEHHNEGNAAKAAAIDLHGMTEVTTAFEAGPWWSHIETALFYSKQDLATELWSWFEVQLLKKKIVLHHYYNKRTRHFVLKCNCCAQSFIMVYDAWVAKAEIEARVSELARFTNCTYTKSGGS